MKTDYIEFKTTKRFRQYAVLYKKHWFFPWNFVADSEGVITLFSEKERDDVIAKLEQDGRL